MRCTDRMSTPARGTCLGSTGDERDGRGHQKRRVEPLHHFFLSPFFFLGRATPGRAPGSATLAGKNSHRKELGRCHGKERCAHSELESAAPSTCAWGDHATPLHALDEGGAQLSLFGPHAPAPSPSPAGGALFDNA